MAAVLGVGTLTGSIAGADIVFAQEENEESEAAGSESDEEAVAEEADSDSSAMKVGAMKGPTAMGMAQLLDDGKL